ncbi:MAG: hypothetical protein DME00_28105 [Candidatus Rokuibacteriota bacterium]|nr:MAG: hypothetical protein DME00_28105 [Candidatus Rokubacteria bacterium]PYO09848.1 MAG: hypothetical protein DMD75_14655 [Candidatus Rokubacteria bacterium]
MGNGYAPRTRRRSRRLPAGDADVPHSLSQTCAFRSTSYSSSGDYAVTRYTATGTHRGDLMGIAPTNRRAESHGCTIVEIKNESGNAAVSCRRAGGKSVTSP